jgi:hydroxymethylpyrimidine/phosphomethylpyrimidine kinase
MSSAAVTAQLAAAGPVQAVKIGMLGSAQVIGAVNAWLADFHGPIVIDPVLSATAGGSLLSPEALPLLETLLRKATLVTPNLPELAVLGGESWLQDHPGAVLVKGGHGSGDSLTDRLVHLGQERTWRHRRVPGEHRGTGCRLASAIAARLALGQDLSVAVQGGIAWLQGWLKTPPDPASLGWVE